MEYHTVLAHDCETLSSVGPILAAKLKKCGIQTIKDLIFHLPFRYQDRTHLTPISDLRPKEFVVIAGRVCKTEIKLGKRRMLYCYVEDNSAIIRLRFFFFNQSQVQAMNQCTRIRAFGEVRVFSNQFEMIHPEYTLYQEEQPLTVEESLTPLYPSTEGLTQSKLRQLIKLAFKTCEQELATLEWMSAEQLAIHGFLSLPEALLLLHYPPPHTSLSLLENGQHPALKRLVFEELLAQRLSLRLAKQKRQRLSALAFPLAPDLSDAFLQSLPFTCTSAQQRVCAQIYEDIQLHKPMLRLVQGDVGCGKTVVATLAALPVIAAGYQVALMAPTDLLSEQHYLNLTAWLSPLSIQTARLSGKMKAKARREVLEQVATNACQLLIGTHAIFQDQVEFHQLGLIIIDEQHRFGVEQRLLLQQKSKNHSPHQLLMTATPIPRSLAMTHFAHLDLSIIDELPPGRLPVQTLILHEHQRPALIQRLDNALSLGKQAYWVCSLIEESEKLQCQAAIEAAKNLQQQLPKARIALLHGRLSSAEKESTMAAFKQGQIDLLVATTVIEVGVDVPNASLMIIENAERLGLSQLHQLRGRVGRGHEQSYCLLLYQAPLSLMGKQRLQTLRETNDGFKIAEKDLQLRGAGEFLGTKQTGFQSFKIADLARDQSLLPIVAETAQHLLSKQHALAKTIAHNWYAHSADFIHS